MKLVEILARELKEWPEGAACIAQNESGHIVLMNKTAIVRKGSSWYGVDQCSILYFDHGFSKSTDHATAIVTREMWEAELARLHSELSMKGKPKANKDGWIRHRGGKCPVAAGQSVTIRCRDGLILDFGRACNICWAHKSSTGDVMAYRIHKPAEQPVIDLPQGYGEVITATLEAKDGPLQWRDRITEIDRTVEALEEERVSLIQRLECEGLQLLPAKVCAPAHHAYDWQVSSVTEGKFIQAIKQHRNLYGSGLKEAKEAVEQYRDANTPSA